MTRLRETNSRPTPLDHIKTVLIVLSMIVNLSSFDQIPIEVLTTEDREAAGLTEIMHQILVDTTVELFKVSPMGGAGSLASLSPGVGVIQGKMAGETALPGD
mmetsp:Transcript_11550/g.25021  ORF Transcript_11550/g.25021 Transcript_11550/m.25021 type:complete len:102 (+) Transcript_11550:2339-2644(+)